MASLAQDADLIFMRRCLELASKGEGFTRPNPMVGSVIVHNGKIIGEGYHRKAGTPHAEVNAINCVNDRELLKHSTLYVSLEPCSHFGKTPPCADLIISMGIPKVVAGTTDTSAKVAGRGFEKLRAAGIEVVTGVEDPLCRRLNRRFFTFHEKRRPWVILKWAESSDGFIDINRQPGDRVGPTWITGQTERVLVHRWRAEEDAILAGGATVRADDPALNVRLWSGNNPVRIVVSKSGSIPQKSKIFNTPGEVLLFTADKNAGFDNCRIFNTDKEEIPVREILQILFEKGIQSVIIEGGAQIHKSFIESGLWDEARIFTGKRQFVSGIKAPEIAGVLQHEHSFPESILRVWYPESSEFMII